MALAITVARAVALAVDVAVDVAVAQSGAVAVGFIVFAATISTNRKIYWPPVCGIFLK